jgi:SAM-dependent methyltransferase
MNISIHDQQLIDERVIGRFDQDYMDDPFLDQLLQTIATLNSHIEEVADFGGGNGRFLDRLLHHLPNAHGTNYEISAYMRSLNTCSSQKTVLADSFLSIDAYSKFDLVIMNWVLHHIIGRDLSTTLRLIHAAVEIALRILKPGGLVVVSENFLKSICPERFASAALFLITRSKFLKPIASRMRDGSAVAGLGLYYMSEPQLRTMFLKFEHIATFDRKLHDHGWKIRLIGITRVTEKVLIFKKP